MEGRVATVNSEAFPLETTALPKLSQNIPLCIKNHEIEFGVKLLLIGYPFAEVSPKALQAINKSFRSPVIISSSRHF